MFDDMNFDDMSSAGDTGFLANDAGEGLARDWQTMDVNERVKALNDYAKTLCETPYDVSLGNTNHDGLLQIDGQSLILDMQQLIDCSDPQVILNSMTEGVNTLDESHLADSSSESGTIDTTNPNNDKNIVENHADRVKFGSLSQCEHGCKNSTSDPTSYIYKVYK